MVALTPWPLYIRTHTPYMPQAQYWQERILELSGHCIPIVQQDEEFNARQLRRQPSLQLLNDKAGLWLAVHGMKMQPDWLGQLPRLKRAGIRSELIAQACQVEQQPCIIDATAGLGHDALLLAWLGATVRLIEQHPIVAVLLESALSLAQMQPELSDVCKRLSLYIGRAEQILPSLKSDIIYLDPMFNKAVMPSKKNSLVKKEMQILQHVLAHQPTDAQQLFYLARQQAKRVIIKRPRYAEPLSSTAPDYAWLGDACRFDGYFQVSFKPDVN